MAAPSDYPPEITGYTEPWIASPGETVAVKVSCTEPEYRYRFVRVIQGVDMERAPKKQLEEISTVPAGIQQGRYQLARPGSYACIEDFSIPPTDGPLEIRCFAQPHLLDAGHPQAILSNLDVVTKSGIAILIVEGSIQLWIGTGGKVEVVDTAYRPLRKRWIGIELVLSGTACRVHIKPIPYLVEKAPASLTVEAHLGQRASFSSNTLLFASCYAESVEAASSWPGLFFNGRVEKPTFIVDGNVFAQYDFSLNIPEDTILDTSGNKKHGVLINAPTRAVTGHDWDGHDPDWTKAKYGYGAIHFHEDDLDDACWETDFSLSLPTDLRSGVYGIELESSNGKTTDMIPLIVRPTAETTAKVGAKVALVLSTFTYLAYANEKLADPTRTTIEVGPDFDPTQCIRTEDFHRMMRRSDLGISTYDSHVDGSGVVFSSSKRPILNFRTGYIMWAFNRPRELSAESMMIGYLEQQQIPYDVLTDHDLHAHGAAVLAPYNTVMTGCHPEYPTLESYDAYQRFAQGGGNLMYLGGNGFYWVTAVDTQRPWRMEIRRGDQGVRSYSLDGGERFLSLNGTQGGIWRSRGRSSHGLFGVAFCAEGTGPGVPFRRTAESHDLRFAWMFTGIEGELVGEFGLGGGASGDEIDSFDVKCGSPPTAVVVATSTGHPDAFGITTECVTFPIGATLGTQTKEIRSDMVYYETTAGGAVFSVGSINWYCSLGWDDYQNSAAVLTGNVIREFLRREEQK